MTGEETVLTALDAVDHNVRALTDRLDRDRFRRRLLVIALVIQSVALIIMGSYMISGLHSNHQVASRAADAAMSASSGARDAKAAVDLLRGCLEPGNKCYDDNQANANLRAIDRTTIEQQITNDLYNRLSALIVMHQFVPAAAPTTTPTRPTGSTTTTSSSTTSTVPSRPPSGTTTTTRPSVCIPALTCIVIP